MKINYTFLHKGVKHALSITKVFCDIFVGIPQPQNGTSSMYLLHRNIFLQMKLYFTTKKSSLLSYTPHPYLEALAMESAVSYIP